MEKSYPRYITDNEVDLVIEGIKQFTKPFFMMVQFFSDHRPFEPPHQYEHIYDDVRIPEPGTFYDDYSLRAAPAREARMRIAEMPDFHPPAELTERQRKQWNYQKLMERFLGTLKAQDDNMGRLLDYLDKSGLAENSIVIFTGDHGFLLGDHGWFDKRLMYEQALRVPWMIRGTRVVKAGSVSRGWVGERGQCAHGTGSRRDSRARPYAGAQLGSALPRQLALGLAHIDVLPLLRIRSTALGNAPLRYPHRTL